MEKLIVMLIILFFTGVVGPMITVFEVFEKRSTGRKVSIVKFTVGFVSVIVMFCLIPTTCETYEKVIHPPEAGVVEAVKAPPTIPKPVIAVYMSSVDERTARVILLAAEKFDATVLVCSDEGVSDNRVKHLRPIPGVHLQHTLAMWLDASKQRDAGLVVISDKRTGAFEPVAYKASTLKYEDIAGIEEKLLLSMRSPITFEASEEARQTILRFKHVGE